MLALDTSPDLAEHPQLSAELRWTSHDDELARALLTEASCYPRPKVERPAKSERTCSIFNRSEYCSNPYRRGGISLTTGEITNYDQQGRPRPCRERTCDYCGKTEAIRLSFKIMHARPTHEFCLTLIGETPKVRKQNERKLLGKLRKIDPGFEWVIAVEVPEGNHRHVHSQGFCKTTLTQSQFQQAATDIGYGRSQLHHIPTPRKHVAQHFSYIFKSLDSPDPVVLSEFLKWNARGQHVGFESHTQGFFKELDMAEVEARLAELIERIHPDQARTPGAAADPCKNLQDESPGTLQKLASLDTGADDAPHATNDDSDDVATTPHTSPQEPLEVAPPTIPVVNSMQGLTAAHSKANLASS
jgi:hypothetical protein